MEAQVKTNQNTPAIAPLTAVVKLPSIQELITQDESYIKNNQLMVLLNQPPPKEWVKEHPTVKSKYLPIARVEYLLSRIFTKWWVEVKSTSIIANSVTVTIRLFVVNPIDGSEMWQDGVGAAPIQTNSGAGATDWAQVKSTGVQQALPIAKSGAIKDAAECFGKIFGKDLSRKDEIGYNSLLITQVDIEDLKFLFDAKKDVMSKEDAANAERIITNQEKNSYSKLFKQLQSL